MVRVIASAVSLLCLGGALGCFRSGFEQHPGAPAPGQEEAGPDAANPGDAGWADAALADAALADAISGDSSLEDAGVLDPFVTTHAVLGVGRYVELDVDWGRSLAYLSSQEPGVCFEVVDFINPSAPSVLKSLGPATTPATICDASRGNQLFDGNTKLVVSSHDPGNIELWDLGADPRAGQYQRLTSLPLGHVRRVAAIDETGPLIDLYMCLRNGTRTFAFDPNAPSLSETSSWIGADNQADAAVFDLSFFLTAGWIADAPIKVIRVSDMQEVQSFDMTNGVNANGLWSVAVSADGTRAFFGGWVSAFFSCDSAVLDAPCTLTQRFDNDAAYRDVVFAQEASGTLLYGIRNDRVIDVFDATAIDAPVLVGQHAIAVGSGEAYGLRVDTQSRRVVIITTDGDFIIGDLDAIGPAAAGYPSF